MSKEKTVATIMQKMMEYSEGSTHDINHFMKVYTYAKTIGEIDGIDYQILVEADYLVNADEGKYSKENITNTYENVFKTQTGKSP